ncbi:radical SAM protein [Thermosphaera aggregans]|uniref:Radical SAM domain protein n=1 Tax=Thermosphaera aggregans (strain DSM 11486 / M11TL) TaxID=633148 RepID=D5U1H2_THEAM|nr:radical SAM protein [Thermosphaera aggregans]ADG90972.1 Radical SAM domain protein [Thermosphaera aggregans DSM 11486]
MNTEIDKPSLIGRFAGRPLYYLPKGVPGLGFIAAGVVDRGTNVIQVRPTTICPMNCAFCSVDSGPFSSKRQAEYLMDLEGLLEAFNRVASVKTAMVEALIDTVGEGLTYPYIYLLIRYLKQNPRVKSVALETHGAPLSKYVIDRLWEAGLDRVNLSIDTFNKEKARVLYGLESYDPARIASLAEYLVKETDIDLHVTPLWLPGINDQDVVNVLNWALRIGAGKRWPPVTVQKFNVHKHGRNRLNIKPVSWEEFYNWLENLEERLGVKLRWSMSEWGMTYDNRIPILYRKGELVGVMVVADGWLKGEFLGVTLQGQPRLITLIQKKGRPLRGGKYIARIIENKDGIYVGKIIGEA